MMMKTKRSSFWRIYALSLCVSLMIIAAALAVFYDAIRAYETSQPQNAADAYASSLSRDTLKAMVYREADTRDFPYNTAKEAADAIWQSYEQLPAPFTATRNYAASSMRTPVYSVFAGDTHIADITLEEAEGGAYGFSEWRIASAAAILPSRGKYQLEIIAPADASVSLNGILLDMSLATEVSDSAEYISPFERHNVQPMQKLLLEGLFSVNETSCNLNGSICPSSMQGDTVCFLYPDTAMRNYQIIAPADASITVNGIPLTAAFRTEEHISYSYSPLEAHNTELPFATRYTVERLLSAPVVEGTLGDTALAFSEQDGVFTAPYPEEHKYSLTLRVPQGSTVSCGDLSLAPYKTAQESAYAELFSETANPPMLDVYTLSGLYQPCDTVKVVCDGQELPIQWKREGRVQSAVAAYPTVQIPAAEERVLAFAKDYFHYVSMGYSNTDANLVKALTHVRVGSTLYTRIRSSAIGIEFVTPVTSSKYRTLTLDSVYRVSETRVVCEITFDIEQKIYYVTRDYAGIMQLSCIKIGDEWYVDGMLINNN